MKNFFWGFLLALGIGYVLAQVSVPGGVSYIGIPTYTVATLPACTAANKGAVLIATDTTTPTYNGALTGGSNVIVPVFCNGTAWSSH